MLPQRARGGVCLDTDTARTVTLALIFDLIFSSLINSIQEQENTVLGRLKNSQELDKTDATLSMSYEKSCQIAAGEKFLR